MEKVAEGETYDNGKDFRVAASFLFTHLLRDLTTTRLHIKRHWLHNQELGQTGRDNNCRDTQSGLQEKLAICRDGSFVDAKPVLDCV